MGHNRETAPQPGDKAADRSHGGNRAGQSEAEREREPKSSQSAGKDPGRGKSDQRTDSDAQE
jgi:hypothetical protein